MATGTMARHVNAQEAQDFGISIERSCLVIEQVFYDAEGTGGLVGSRVQVLRIPRGGPRHCFSDLLTWVGCWGQAGCMGRGDLTNAEWDRLESFLPRGGTRGGRWSDHRRVINGVLYRVRTGVQWRDLPERFGPWETVYKRHRRWSADGTWKMLL
ncbi:transposase, partial [Streptomyces sp. NPDC002867]